MNGTILSFLCILYFNVSRWYTGDGKNLLFLQKANDKKSPFVKCFPKSFKQLMKNAFIFNFLYPERLYERDT